jgi:streptogramin lyase
MRFVEGTDLKQVLEREGKLDPRRAFYLLGRVADALDAAHARGLVHRDVKPGNVLIAVDPKADPPEHPYLSDFGLTKQTSSDSGITQTGQFVGTADYAAPEQITRGSVGPATDQYALACLLFECLTGQPPYRSEALMAVLWSHVNDLPPGASGQNPELPAAIDGVLARGLAKEPKRRYASCRELVGAARDALGLSGELPQASAATVPLLRRREFLLGAGALAVAAAAAVPAILLTRGGTGAPGLAPRNSVARIDAGSNTVTQIVPDLPEPWTFAVGEGAVWSLSRTARAVTRIDPVTGATSRVSIPGLPYWIAAGEGAIWVTASFESRGYLLELDPGTGNLDNRYPLPYADPLGVAVADGSTWVAFNDLLRGQTVIARYPPRPQLSGGTAAAAAEIRVEASPWWTTINDWFVVASGTVSLLTGLTGVLTERGAPTLRQLDAETGDEILAVELELPEALAVGPDTVWVTATAHPVVYEVEASSGQVTQRADWVTLDTGPILHAHGALWLGDLLRNTLKRIDPASGQVVSTIQVAEPLPVDKAGAAYVFPGWETGAFFSGLRADANGIWAQLGGAPGNVI